MLLPVFPPQGDFAVTIHSRFSFLYAFIFLTFQEHRMATLKVLLKNASICMSGSVRDFAELIHTPGYTSSLTFRAFSSLSGCPGGSPRGLFPRSCLKDRVVFLFIDSASCACTSASGIVGYKNKTLNKQNFDSLPKSSWLSLDFRILGYIFSIFLCVV